MCYWLIKKSGKNIADATVQHVAAEYMRNPDIKEAVDQFEKYIIQILDDTKFKLEAVGSGYF